jgi:indolepyruvate ferredoxin oxidoreductase alpha subunit
MLTKLISGSEALARGALEAGVQFVTGYPGSPSTATVEALLRLDSGQVRVEWAINEKSAFDAALGASLAGMRVLVSLKSVGLNVALDSLMVANMAPGEGGFVILVGDDPGGWGSQNEEDSRPLVASAEVPLLEPTSVAEAYRFMARAFNLSEWSELPVAIRITRALALERVEVMRPGAGVSTHQPARFRRQGDRFNVLPVHVVNFHKELQSKIARVQEVFEWPWETAELGPTPNPVEGSGQKGIIAAGFVYQKLAAVLADSDHPPLCILRLNTVYPLPIGRISAFLSKVEAALVLEETAPYVETEVQALAQRAGVALPIYGRHSGHVPGAGELFAPELAQALTALLPDWPWPAFEPASRTMPSRRPLCEDCPYIPTLEALLAVMERHGGREAFVVTGETGCMVRSQLPPWEFMDVKYGMGSSIGLAAGLARTGISQKVIALSGDSALLHSGLGELVDAVQASIDLLVVVLANQTTALSGGQPHPGTNHDAQGVPRPPVDLVALMKAAGVDRVHVIDPEDGRSTRAAFEKGLTSRGLSVVVAKRACPMWERETPVSNTRGRDRSSAS